ncbi:hypothetical protein GBA52_010459 [Prunus armeniaca]|nr:hypothetical protein GBA52_010459 [Prunus armeniaca]
MISVEKFSLYKNPDRAHILSLTNFGSPMLAFQMVVHCHHFSTSNKKYYFFVIGLMLIR